MISINDLSISFGSRIILDNITLDVAGGEINVLLGKNGSGKSVLLKSLACLIQDYEGIIKMNQRDLNDLCRQRWRKSENEDSDFTIAYVFQRGGLFDSMNVYENVAFGLRRKGVDEVSIEKIITEVLRKVGLTGNENKLPSELSGGMQKRVGFARAICLNPDVILYDDPTAGLDPVLSDSIADIMLDIKDKYKTTSIVATHDLEVAKKIADTIAVLYNGKIVFFGSNDYFFSGQDPYALQLLNGNIEGPIDL